MDLTSLSSSSSSLLVYAKKGLYNHMNDSTRGYHASRMSQQAAAKKKKNKRAAIAKHESKLQDIAQREVKEAKHAEKQAKLERKKKKSVVGEEIDGGEEEEEDEFIDLPSKQEVQDAMMKVLNSMQRAFKNIRGGEISVEIFENITVDAYGTKTPLTALAQIVVATPQRVVMSPYDPSIGSHVRDAVRDAPELNFNPLLEDGEVIVPIPKVSQETRMQTSKQVGKMAEENRKRIRRIRKKFQDKAKKGKEVGFSEDEIFRCSKDIDVVTDEMIKLVNDEVDQKQETIMKV